MVTRLTALVFLLLPAATYSQGWIDITPEGLNPVHFLKGFDFHDGTFQVYAWNSTGDTSRGFRLDNTSRWDSIPASYSNSCGPGSIGAYLLSDIGRSYLNPTRAFSVYVASAGCLIECATYLCRDTSGQVTLDGQVLWLDDFLCAGFYATVAVSPVDDRHVFFAFFDTLYHSADGGITFSPRSTPVPGPFDPMLNFIAVSHIDTNIVFTGGFSPQANTFVLFRSDDMGLTWTAVLDQDVHTMKFQPDVASIAYLSSSSGIYKSSDEGISWSNTLPGGFGSVEIHKDSVNIIFAAGLDGKLHRSTDAGNTWSIFNDTFTSLRLIGLHHIRGSDTVIVASTHQVFKVFDSFVLSINEENPFLPRAFSLSQNYPNPFNPNTNFRFEIRDLGFVSLKVYDVLGREVATLVTEQLPPGRYTRQWNASGMPSGVYFYRLTSGEYVETKKLVLLR